DLNGVSAIVTGGASGLGAATARRLAAAGAQVVIADLQDGPGAELAAEIGGEFAHADVTDTGQLQEAVARAVERGPLRALVNCAGIGPPARTIDREGNPHDLDAYRRVIEVKIGRAHV